MEKVQKSSNFVCYTPSPEPFRINCCGAEGSTQESEATVPKRRHLKQHPKGQKCLRHAPFFADISVFKNKTGGKICNFSPYNLRLESRINIVTPEK
jgi:hypothetical protein